MPLTRWVSGALATSVVLGALVGCGSDGTDDTTSPEDEETPMETTPHPTTSVVSLRGTTFHVEVRGEGPALLLVHGGGEDAGMLAAQADDLAAAGYRVISYDRRGTGRSGREDWPGDGADQHADDAAALLHQLDAAPARVLGVSSGGVVALALAARHPDVVEHAVAWEPPALGVVPGGGEINAQLMGPIDQYLAENPGDFVGAQAMLLTVVVGFPVGVDDPAFAATRANAESMIRGEPAITLRPFTADELAQAPVTIALGSTPNEIVAAASAQLQALTGREPVTAEGDHEIYLTDPTVLTAVVRDA